MHIQALLLHPVFMYAFHCEGIWRLGAILEEVCTIKFILGWFFSFGQIWITPHQFFPPHDHPLFIIYVILSSLLANEHVHLRNITVIGTTSDTLLQLFDLVPVFNQP